MRISPPPRCASDRASEDANVRLLFQLSNGTINLLKELMFLTQVLVPFPVDYPTKGMN